MPGINARIRQVIDYHSNRNVRKFAETINIPQQKLNRLFNIDTRTGKYPVATTDIIQSMTEMYVDIDPDWLLTGKGKMFREQGASSIAKFPLRTDGRFRESQQVPLYELEAAAGLASLFVGNHIPVSYICVPDLPQCDGAIHVRGDSMYPILKSGDIVLYKQVHDFVNGVFWGEMYLVSFTADHEEYIVIKYIQKSEIEGCIKLVSYNSHHAAKDIPITSIRAMAIVKASIRYNTMG